jgi:hypothetical protein
MASLTFLSLKFSFLLSSLPQLPKDLENKILFQMIDPLMPAMQRITSTVEPIKHCDVGKNLSEKECESS